MVRRHVTFHSISIRYWSRNTYAITDYLGNLEPRQASIFEILGLLLPFSLRIPTAVVLVHSQFLKSEEFHVEKYQSQPYLGSFRLQTLLWVSIRRCELHPQVPFLGYNVSREIASQTRHFVRLRSPAMGSRNLNVNKNTTRDKHLKDRSGRV